MARPKKQEAQDTRHLALKAANTLMHQYGYQGFSMDDVAKAIGVRKATLYYHFPDGKEELVLAVADQMMSEDEIGIENAYQSQGTAREQLCAIAEYAFTQRTDGARVLRDALRFIGPEHQQKVFQRFRTKQFNVVHQVFEIGIKNQELRLHNTLLSAWAFMGLLSEMADFPEMKPSELARALITMFVEGLENEKG